MPKLQELRDKVSQAEDALDRTKAELDEYIRPILAATFERVAARSAFYSERVHDICTVVSPQTTEIQIVMRWNASGGPYDTTHRLPASVFEAEDPVAAAKAFGEAQRQARVDFIRAKKEAEFERLRKELGK